MRSCLAAGALVVAGLLAAGCSSGPNGGTGTPASNAGADAGGAGANTAQDSKSLFISCLASHGIPISGRGVTLNRNSPRLRRAEQACRSLLPPSSGTQTITAQDQVDYLRAAQCMRAHGVPQFPDPVFADGGVHFPVPPGLDTHAPQVTGAIAICRRLIPAGLPYSR